MAKKKKHKKKEHFRPDQKPPKHPLDDEQAFTHERCPDCDYAGRLDLLGRPIPKDPMPLRPYPSWLVRRTTRSSGCETCGGSGRVKRQIPIDPMFLKS